VALDDRAGPFEVGFRAVAISDRCHLIGIQLISKRVHLAKRLLKSARGNDLDDERGLVAGILEGMPLCARLKDKVAWLADYFLLAEERSDTAVDDETVLVLPAVAMQWRSERTWRHEVLEQREPSSGLRALDHEPVADCFERSQHVTLAGAQQAWRAFFLHHSSSLHV
jgi:hypothetical protein